MQRDSILLGKLHAYDHIIWDWNGTLLSDVEIVWQVNVGMLTKRDLPSPCFDTYREQFCFPIIDYYKSLGFDFTAHPFEELSAEYMRAYDEVVAAARLFEGTEDMLASLQASGKDLAVLSAAHQDHLQTILQRYNIAHYFSHIYGLSDSYGHSKLARGQELLADAQFNPKRTILVGDTDHDLEVGQALGIDVLLIADGHQSYQRLARAHHNVLPSRFGAKP